MIDNAVLTFLSKCLVMTTDDHIIYISRLYTLFGIYLEKHKIHISLNVDQFTKIVDRLYGYGSVIDTRKGHALKGVIEKK
jgi:hypothetical protein